MIVAHYQVRLPLNTFSGRLYAKYQNIVALGVCMSQELKKTDAEERAAIEKLLAQSRRTDIPALLQAKEKAKQMLRTDPTVAPLLARLDSMLEKAEEKAMATNEGVPEVFKNTGEVLRYLQEEAGRQIAKTKLYEDIKKGLLRKDKRNFRKIDVDKYAASLPRSTTPDGRVADAEDRQRRKELAEIRIKEAQAAREEKRNAVMDGKYVLLEYVDQELAAKAVALNMGLKSKVEANALELVTKVNGKPKRARTLVQEMEKLIDQASNEFAQPMELEHFTFEIVHIHNS